jgi:hypothetical protein
MTSAVMTPEVQRELVETSRQLVESAHDNLEYAAASRELFARFNMTGVADLFRVYEFTLLLQFDLHTLFADFVTHEHDITSHVYARYVILVIYEGTAQYRHLLGKELQDSWTTDDFLKHFVTDLRHAHKALNAVAGQAEQRYSDVRNGIAAHRDKEAAAQLARLRQLGGEEVAKFVIDFSTALGSLLQLLAEITKRLFYSFSNHLQYVMLEIAQETDITVTGHFDGESATSVDPESVNWSSSDPSVVHILSPGRIRGVARGFAQIEMTRDTHPRIDGSVFVFVGDPSEFPDFQRVWRSVFQRHSAQAPI